MRRITALITALIMVLTGCSTAVDEPKKTPFKLELFSAKPKIVLAVKDSLKASSENGINIFVDKVAQLSEGSLKIEVVYCTDPVERFKNKTADMVYAASEDFAQTTNLMKMFSSGFYFRDYNHMTMTLNSKTFYETTSEYFLKDLGGVMLNAVYANASLILSSKDYIDEVTAFKNLEIGLRENEENNFIIEAMGANTNYDTQNQLIEKFNIGELKSIECEIDKIQDIKKLFDEEFFYITETWHDMSLEWLLISDDCFKKNLEYQFAVREASAFLIATLEEERLAHYDEQIDRLVVNGGEITRLAIDPLRKKAKEILQQNKDYKDSWNWEIFDSVQSIIR